MLLPELELDKLVSNLFTRTLDLSRRGTWATEIDTDLRAHAFHMQLALANVQVALIHQPVSHGTEDALEIRSAELRLRA